MSRRQLRTRHGAEVDLTAAVGDVVMPNPVMGASGTAGYGAELSAYMDLAHVGAIVTKSLACFAWGGNPAPRVHETTGGMINSVGLQGPGVERWLADELPELAATGTRVVASIWGRTVEDYATAANMLADAPDQVVAVEVNISCPNTEDRGKMFAHSHEATAAVLEATVGCGRPRWAKLSPNTPEVADIAVTAAAHGASAVTLTNTLIGLVLDPETRASRLGGRTGGLSGPAIRPVAVRAVYDTRSLAPDLPIIGVGGITCASDALEFIMAGANAVQVGTATFADPRRIAKIRDQLTKWCAEHDVASLAELIGAAHPLESREEFRWSTPPTG